MKRKRQLARAAIYYPFRPAGVLASLLDRPAALLSRWDSLASVRPVVGLAAHDAHGGLMSRDDASQRPWVGSVPSYRASFRTFAIRAVPASPLTGVAAADGRAVLDAIRRGRVFTSIDAVAGPAWLDFRADRGDTQATMGDALVYEPDVRLTVRTGLPPGGQLVMICGGDVVANSGLGELSVAVSSNPARVARKCLSPAPPGDPPVPWIVGNPIYLLPLSPNRLGPSHSSKPSLALNDVDWLLEKEPTSTATIVRDEPGFVEELPARKRRPREPVRRCRHGTPATASAIRTRPLHRRPPAPP